MKKVLNPNPSKKLICRSILSYKMGKAIEFNLAEKVIDFAIDQ